jgi:hypothetical protein
MPFATAIALFAITPYAVAQQGVKSTGGSSVIDNVQSPSMPTISSPTIGEGFYTPGNKNNEIYTGPSSIVQSSSKETSTTAPTQNKTATTEDSQKNTTQTTQNIATTAANVLSSLSASDISSLGNMGLLNQLYSATGATTADNALSNAYASTAANVTTTQLNEILSELQELKQKVNAANATTATQTAVTSTANAPTATRVIPSKLIRFTVNGYDVLKTCRIIYISKVQKDGTFLVTGDRKYQSDGATRSETFYVLFKSKGVVNGQQSYTVATEVTQDYTNQYSFLYQLAQKRNLTATQVGNLVSFRTTDPSWKLDMLLDLE